MQCRQSVVGGRLDGVKPERSALDPSDTADGVDDDPAHPIGAEQDDVLEALRGERPGVVPSALRRDPEARGARRTNNGLDVGNVTRHRDSGRTLVDGDVPREPGAVVLGVTREVEGSVAKASEAGGATVLRRVEGKGLFDGHTCVILVSVAACPRGCAREGGRSATGSDGPAETQAGTHGRGSRATHGATPLGRTWWPLEEHQGGVQIPSRRDGITRAGGAGGRISLPDNNSGEPDTLSVRRSA